MTDPILLIELRLLILRHGRRRVLEALSTLGEQTLEALEAELAKVQEATVRKKSKSRAKPQLEEILAQECRDKAPEIARIIQSLATRYENKSFLPELKDVQRFIDRFGTGPLRKLKNRNLGIHSVIKVLANMSLDELQRLAESGPIGDSDYAVLARQIMGRGPAARRDYPGDKDSNLAEKSEKGKD